MNNTFQLLVTKPWFKALIFIILTFIPSTDYYIHLINNIIHHPELKVQISSMTFITDLITGLLLAGMFLLYARSTKEYLRIKNENKRIREMLLTIHLLIISDFINKYRIKIKIFDNEESAVKTDIKRIFNMI